MSAHSEFGSTQGEVYPGVVPSTTGESDSLCDGVEPRQIEIQPEWLTYRAAEVYASLSRTTLWRLISDSEVKAARIGRAVRINRASLDEYLSRQKFGNAS